MKAATGEDTLKAVVHHLKVIYKDGHKNYNDIQTKCEDCIHARKNPHTHHILCSNPPKVIEANKHGIKNGWFLFPVEFDPIWRTGECGRYAE